ncbi:MAG: hypothetical protein WC265_04365 [Dysgonamonadaceae bacterium]|jgi:hypothetical protein
MIDFIEVSKHLSSKDTLFTGHLQQEASYSSGWQKYFITGCENMEFWHQQNNEMIKLKGSVMYFLQGHNFTFDKKKFIEGLKYIEDLTRIPLFDASVDKFEYATIIQTDQQPKEIIRHHREGKGMKVYSNPKDRGHFKAFSDSNTKLKMYDAGKNIKMKQGLHRQQIIADKGWDASGNYLKWEAHYLKPHIVLNNGRGIKLADLTNPKFENIFKEDLYIQYQRLIPMKSLLIPNDKKDLSTPDLLVRNNVARGINEGMTIEEIKKELYAEINSYPEEVLSKADKDHRKRQIKSLLEKLKLADKSQWDISDRLAEALNSTGS